MASHDALTDLPNQTLLRERVAEALAAARSSGREVALLYVDLNDFKLVNDSLGHTAGDELLVRVGARLRELVREGDTIARQGGDEFLLLLAGLRSARSAAERVSTEIARALEEPFSIGPAVLEIGASVGISTYPDDATNAQDLQRHADTAMYRAKEAGGGHALYEPRSEDPLARLTLAARMRRALEQREFQLHYQPIWRLGDEPAIRGVEALIRWQDPDHGLISPADFIPVAERTGVIDAIGDWVLDELARQAGNWLDYGLAPNLGVNVSPRQLRNPSFADRFVKTVVGRGLDPHRFIVELTESAWMLEGSRGEPVLRALVDAGLRLGIDDFGAGYSSLARLRALPVDIIKIDRAFMTGLPDDPEACAIVTAIMQLSAACGCEVVAEGIETVEQLDFLTAQGCRLGQGFHLGRPVPSHTITALLHEHLSPDRRH